MLWPLPLVTLVSVKRREHVLVKHVFSTTQSDVVFRRLPCSSQDTAFLGFYAWATYGQNANTEKLEEGTFPIIKKERKKINPWRDAKGLFAHFSLFPLREGDTCTFHGLLLPVNKVSIYFHWQYLPNAIYTKHSLWRALDF